MYLHVDLCCGLGGWQEPFREASDWRTVGLDIRRDLSPDVQADVRELPLTACEPELVTASPPCTQFSTSRPEPMDARNLDWSVWEACWNAINHLKPTYWVVENVRGMVYWHPDYRKQVGRDWFLWGFFPPFDLNQELSKDRSMRYEPDRLAKIPYPLADGLRQAVETWL